MNPPIFSVASASSAVTALLGSDPVRFYLFGEADEKTPTPYAVWQTVYGRPENYLSGTPDLDHWGVQVDVYAKSASQSREVAMALRDAFEPLAYVAAWNGEHRELETKLYRYSFTVEFMISR